jgi:AcrR family transcriptional regulator
MRDQEGPRPGRPRQADVSGRILTAARELIAARSWERISLDEVATRAGVAKTTLYRRWRSKDELAVATLEHALQPGYDFGDEFDVGLELVIEGLAARLAAEQA